MRVMAVAPSDRGAGGAGLAWAGRAWMRALPCCVRSRGGSVVQKEAATNCAARAKSRGSPGAKSCGVRVFGELWYPAGARSGRRGPPRAGGGGFRGVQIVRTRLPALYGARGCG